MSSINPLHSFSGYLQEALNGATQVDAQDNTLIGLKIAAKIVGQAALTLLSLIETVARYAIANGSWIIS